MDEQGQLVETESKITPKLNLLQAPLVVACAIPYSCAGGFARFYEKADALDWVIFGWAIGIWLSVTFATFVRDPLY